MDHITIYDIDKYIGELLNASKFDDIAINGIQVENEGDVHRIAFAVDAAVDTIEEAARRGCEMLVTHHGIFWGRPEPIVGSHGMRVRSLITHNIGLISYHIPLDASEICGNNICMCRLLGLKQLNPFGKFKGSYVGYIGTADRDLDIDDVFRLLGFDSSRPHTYLGFGSRYIRMIAIVSGGAGHDIAEAVRMGADLFITGECSHELYHYAKESRINGLFLGHYWTEVFGVRALSEQIRQRFPNIETEFIDVPTGL